MTKGDGPRSRRLHHEPARTGRNAQSFRRSARSVVALAAAFACLGFRFRSGLPGAALLNDALEAKGFRRVLDERERFLRNGFEYPDAWWPPIAKEITGREKRDRRRRRRRIAEEDDMKIWKRVAIVLGAVVLVGAAGLVARVLMLGGVFDEVKPVALACKALSGVTGAEDIAVDRKSGLVFVSAADRRVVGSKADGIYTLSLAHPEAGPVRLAGAPSGVPSPRHQPVSRRRRLADPYSGQPSEPGASRRRHLRGRDRGRRGQAQRDRRHPERQARPSQRRRGGRQSAVLRHQRSRQHDVHRHDARELSHPAARQRALFRRHGVPRGGGGPGLRQRHRGVERRPPCLWSPSRRRGR